MADRNETIIAFMLGILTNIISAAVTNSASPSLMVQIETSSFFLVLILIAIILAILALFQARSVKKRLDELFSSNQLNVKPEEKSKKKGIVRCVQQVDGKTRKHLNGGRADLKAPKMCNENGFKDHENAKSEMLSLTTLARAKSERIQAFLQFYKARNKKRSANTVMEDLCAS